MNSSSLARYVVLCAICATGAFSQTAQITGTITDQSGAVAPQTTVTATNMYTGVSRSTTANDSGNYLITALLPGAYSVTALAAGFKKMDRESVRLEIDKIARIDFVLQLGEVQDTVTVDASGVLLDAATSTVGSIVESKQIADLPLNGRGPTDLLALNPGIRIQGGFGGVMTTGGTTQGNAWSGFSFNGGIAGANPMLVEGLALDLAVMNLPSYVPPADATQEFRAQTSTFSAEYGRTTGAVISFSIKSGTNQLHATGYEYWRNRDLNANNFFQNRAGTPRPGFNQNQFGGSMGGPIRKDKVFFFSNFEEYRIRQAVNAILTVPTALQVKGDFSQTRTAAGALIAIADPLNSTLQPNGTSTRSVFAGNIIPSTRISTVARNVADLFPAPNVTGAAFTNVNNYSSQAPTNNNQHNIVGKLDYNLSSRWKLFGTIARLWDHPLTTNQWPSPIDFTRNQTSSRYHATTSATAVLSPSLILELRTGFARLNSVGVPAALGYDITKLGLPKILADTADIKGFPAFRVTGMAAVGGGNSAGANVGAFNSWTERAMITWVKGLQTLKFGGDFRVQQMNHLFQNSLLPIINFTNQMTAINPLSLNTASGVPMASFMLGYVSTASGAKSPAFANQRKYASLFVQDDWKVTRKFTLNLGLDYSLEFPLTDRYNRKMWFDQTAQVPASSVLGQPIIGGFRFASSDQRYPFDLYKKQFGPRAGVVYQLSPSTVIRSAFGLFWIPANLTEVVGGSRAPAWELSTQMAASLDNGVTPFDTLDNPFPKGLQTPPGSASGLNSLLGQAVAANRRFIHTGYMMQWNFNIQQQISRNGAVTVGYAGSSGVGLPAQQATQFNQLEDKYLSLGSRLTQQVPNPYYPLVQQGLIKTGPLAQPQVQYGQLLRPYPQFDTLFDEANPVGHSSYHSFQLEVKQRFGHGLLTAAYTISKALADSESRLDQGSNSSGALNNYNRRLQRALTTYDAPQRLVISYSYELPFGRGQSLLQNLGALDRVVSGWQVSGIYTAQSGTPIAVTSATNLTGNYNAVTDVYGSFFSNAVPNSNGQNANLSGPAQERLNQWFCTSCFSQPAPFTYGNAGRTLPNVRGHGIHNFDVSLAKNLRFGHEDRYVVQFRGEAFNSLNHVRFSSPGGQIGNATFGVVSAQQNNPRQLQLSLRFSF